MRIFQVTLNCPSSTNFDMCSDVVIRLYDLWQMLSWWLSGHVLKNSQEKRDNTTSPPSISAIECI